MIKKILLAITVVIFLSVPALARNIPEFDAVGADQDNIFVDQVLAAIITNGVTPANNLINLFSDFTTVGANAFNGAAVGLPVYGQVGANMYTAEFFATTAGSLYVDPCFNFLVANDYGSAAHVPYKSALTTQWNSGLYRWRIVLQRKPESDLNINIEDCVLKGNETYLWWYADQTGWYRWPWGQLSFSPANNPMIYAVALPGRYATPGFTSPIILDARLMPTLRCVPLCGQLYTTKAPFDEGIVVALPYFGATNGTGQQTFDLHQGDMIDIVVQINATTADVYYGPDNVFLKYVGIFETSFTNPEGM